MEDYEIDDFEKLYALTVAELNDSVEISERTFDENRFGDICNLAKFKKEHPEMFDEKNRNIIDDDFNCYVIPRSVKQKIRVGNKEQVTETEAYILIDSSGNKLGLILENGTIIKDSKENEVLEKSNIEEKEHEELDETITKDKEDEKGEESAEKEDVEEEIKSVNPNILETISQKYKCKLDQISIRKVDDLEKVEEDTGLNLRAYRGKVIAVRINYGYEQRYYLMNSETGELFNPNKMEINRGETYEVQDYFKYRFIPGEEQSRSLRNDEGRSYITYLDENGNQKEMKFINNGKEVDMLKEERERYIAEVDEATLLLQQSIDEYQQVNSHENWLKVAEAMKIRVMIDKKYNVLENQKEVTKDTIYETIDETLGKHGKEDNEFLEEEYDPRRRRDPRWD